MNETAYVVVKWSGNGTEETPYTPALPALPALPEGSKWEDVSTAAGVGIPGGSETYTIKITAETAFMEQLSQAPGLVVVFRESAEQEDSSPNQINQPRQPDDTPSNVEYAEFRNKLIEEGLYANDDVTLDVYGADVLNRSWRIIVVFGILRQVARANTAGGAGGGNALDLDADGLQDSTIVNTAGVQVTVDADSYNFKVGNNPVVVIPR